MDLTPEFRRLAGLRSVPDEQDERLMKPRSGFILQAEEQQSRLKRGLEGFNASVAQLEASLEVADASRDDLGHRRGVVAALYEELRTLAERVQREQVSQLEREAEVASFFTAPMAPSKAPMTVPPVVPAMEDLGLPNLEEQRLLATFSTDLDKIQETRAKIEEVATMVGLFATKVAEQTEQTDECYQLTEQSTSYVEGAQKHLERAIENRNSYRFYVVCWFLGSAIFLLVFDYIDSRWSLI
ncbi:Syntaxin-18 [Durusdinium trenchii]|uniref:Syntaxin-18 n=1 Tax=Durusdinium trenchii TaxID=1381693 RepID=A0ABP0HD39_9DINO